MKSRTFVKLGAAMVSVGLVATACGSSGTTKSSSGKTVVTVEYSSNYVYDSVPLVDKLFNGIKAQFDAKYPNATLKLDPIPGAYTDLIEKLSLLYRSHSTAPSVAMIPTGQIGLWASSGYLLPMNSYLQSASWWKNFPKVVQGEGTFGGQVYAVNDGENTSTMYYDKTIFRKVGLPVPWRPKTWADILSAAETIKAKDPGVYPLWAEAGTASGTNGILQGAGNLIDGSTTPTIYDAKTKKWVIDSSGLEATLNFYHTVYSKGLGVPISDLFSPSGVGEPISLFPKGNLGIAIGSNYFGELYPKAISAPYWAAAPKVLAAAPIPTEFGQSPGIASTLGGYDLAIYKNTSSPSYAFDLVNLMESEENQINSANWAGFIPPDTEYVKSNAFVNFAPPFNAVSASVLPDATITPSSADYSVWGQGFNEATGLLAQKPTTSVAQALSTFESYVKNQLTSSFVEKQ